MNLFRRSNSQFVAGYRSARVIIDRPGHARRAEKTDAGASVNAAESGRCGSLAGELESKL